MQGCNLSRALHLTLKELVSLAYLLFCLCSLLFLNLLKFSS
jgi:hypothetical protein